MDSDSQIIISNEKLYQLSSKSLKDLSTFKPITDEILNAYVKLLANRRLHSNNYHFHLFDTMFFHQLASQSNNFLSFFSTSQKQLFNNSIVLFVVPVKNDYVLVVAYL